MKYLVVTSKEAYAIDARRFAIDGALCDHLKALATASRPLFDELVVAAPPMSHAAYLAGRAHLGVLDAAAHEVSLRLLPRVPAKSVEFGSYARSLVLRLLRLVRVHDLVCASLLESNPAGTAALALAAMLGKKTLAVIDGDVGDDAHMRRGLGRRGGVRERFADALSRSWRRRSSWAVARFASLALVEGSSARSTAFLPHVRRIESTGFSAHHVIGERMLERKIEALSERHGPLELLYLGRLAPEKGVDRCIAALSRARALGREDVRLTIMGSGEEEARLRRLVAELALEERVAFRRPLRYGEPFFTCLRPHHLAIAAPLVEEAPRAVWDALASGVPWLAFDTDFYRRLEREGAATTVEWPSADALGARIAYFARHRDELGPMMKRAVELARENTSERWLRRRTEWTFALFGQPVHEAHPDPVTFVAA